MELELAPALFIQPYGSGIIAPGKPTQQNATATRSINVLPVDVSAGVHSGHNPPPSPASRTRAGMTGAQPPAHTQPKKIRSEKSGAAKSAGSMFPRYPHRPRTRTAHMTADALDLLQRSRTAARAPDPRPGRRSCSVISWILPALRSPPRPRTAATAADPRPGRRSCSGDLLDPAGAQISAAATDGSGSAPRAKKLLR